MAFVTLLGPREIERFAAPDPEEEAITAAAPKLTRQMMEPYLPYLPARERDVVELRLSGKTTREIGRVLGLSQPGVSVRWRKAIERIRWLRGVESIRVPEEELRAVLTEELLTEACGRGGRRPRVRYSLLELVIGMTATTCLSEAARRAGARGITARDHWMALLRGLETLSEEDKRLERILAYLRVVDLARNILWDQPSKGAFWERTMRGRAQKT